MSPWSCHQTLRELTSLGLLELVTAGRNFLFTLNLEHHLIKEILLPLFEKESTLLREFLQAALEGLGDRLRSVYLFGSIARGDEAPFSGVDLLIVVPNAQEREGLSEELLERRLRLLLKFGNLIQPYIVTASELREKLQAKHPLFQKIREEGRCVHGKELGDAALDSTETGT